LFFLKPPARFLGCFGLGTIEAMPVLGLPEQTICTRLPPPAPTRQFAPIAANT
jgi:hypothetical protein